ncbi:M61 family metallopeptidase [Dyadobacter jiangsuensis]|uniref:Putative metalloprotease with PDZ domain n=1 Tax=Dyadobacter jiangsuensis TaxID=1591085 RepID=A0A2P8FQ70_9BACT|nr:peptidase M61 [Dyadobacter jiangsuensis]PSL23843.1 putative metalloprotease with PDZ domain [Dyadobacter jiangsuensis]
MKTSPLIPLLFLLGLGACSVSKTSSGGSKNTIQVSIDLQNVDADRVRVKVVPPRQKSGTVAYRFPKIIPGTYAIADYGRYVDDIKAFNKDGSELKTSRPDSNTVVIENARQLAYLSYLVNDTFDNEEDSDPFSEKSKTIFSPAGTNIDAGKYFLLNMAGFVGYFTDQLEKPYRITIAHPEALYGTTAMVDRDDAARTDVFNLSRYPEVVDHPVMYAPADTAAFRVNDMQVLLGVYSRRGKTHASDLRPDLEKMIRAQKRFLGPINDTQKYAVLAYISSGADDDAKGIGALEHNTSTSAVFREPMKSKDLIHVISHEFFHTIAPLKVHSKEIQYFDFNNPKMSQHLWFYEGVTEYFSNLFQVNQGLIDDHAFYDLMAQKMEASRNYNDKLSFTEMSRNILDSKMKAQYPNVYQKGALIAMCLDIVIREQTQGQRGLLWLMGELSKKYGADKPFDDAELIPTITQIAGDEAGKFLVSHVQNGERIVYADFLAKVGLKKQVVPFPEPIVFVTQDVAYIKTDSSNTQVMASVPDDANQFYQNLGIKDNDIFLEFNGIPVNPKDANSIIYLGYDLDEGSPITVKVNRAGQDMELKGTVKLNYDDADSFRFGDTGKKDLNEAWLKK